jgi:hypothetical protein
MQGFSKPAPTSQAADFFGHGLSFESVPAATNRWAGALLLLAVPLADRHSVLHAASCHQHQMLLVFLKTDYETDDSRTRCAPLSCSEVEQLRTENEQLRQQLQHQQQLLLIWQQQPCTLCQLHSTHASTNSSIASSSKSRSTGTRGSSSTSLARLGSQDASACRNTISSSEGSAADGAGCCRAVQCRLDRALRQQQVQLAQMQKQVLVLQVGRHKASVL